MEWSTGRKQVSIISLLAKKYFSIKTFYAIKLKNYFHLLQIIIIFFSKNFIYHMYFWILLWCLNIITYLIHALCYRLRCHSCVLPFLRNLCTFHSSQQNLGNCKIPYWLLQKLDLSFYKIKSQIYTSFSLKFPLNTKSNITKIHFVYGTINS